MSIYSVLYLIKALCLKQFFTSDEEAKAHWLYEKDTFTKSHMCSTDVFKISRTELFWCPEINCQRRYESKSELESHKKTYKIQKIQEIDKSY